MIIMSFGKTIEGRSMTTTTPIKQQCTRVDRAKKDKVLHILLESVPLVVSPTSNDSPFDLEEGDYHHENVPSTSLVCKTNFLACFY